MVKLSKQGSINTFYREFRQATGSTPARILRRTRVEKACQMLKETDASITAISAACGFSSPNYFAQVFLREMGVSAREYRKGKKG